MDLQLTQGSWEGTLSDVGFYRIVINDQAPASEIEQRVVKGRNGFLHAGVRFSQKTINVTARICLPSQLDFQQKQDEVRGLLVTDKPFYITKMYPERDELYDFELPGQASGELAVQGQRHLPWHYRFLVVVKDEPSFEFIGRSNRGLLYRFSVSFVTANLPFGETIPRELMVSGGGISYRGTASLSQLEWPFVVSLVADRAQSDVFLEIGGRRWTYRSQTPLAVGDRLDITALETRLNGVNVTAKTNYAYFVLEPSRSGQMSCQTNFQGEITLKNVVELYK